MAEETDMKQLSLIVAMAKNGVIGVNNRLPWRLPVDLKHFKSVTLGKPIIMGRKTFDSIGQPLPGRLNIVVTGQQGWHHEGVTAVNSLTDAVALAKSEATVEAVLIGGAALYQQGLALCDKMYLTEVDCEVEGDAFFPLFDRTLWRKTAHKTVLRDDKNPYNCDFLVLQRNK